MGLALSAHQALGAPVAGTETTPNPEHPINKRQGFFYIVCDATYHSVCRRYYNSYCTGAGDFVSDNRVCEENCWCRWQFQCGTFGCREGENEAGDADEAASDDSSDEGAN